MVSRRERMVMATPAPQTALHRLECCASDGPCALLIRLASVFSRELVAQVRIALALHCIQPMSSPCPLSEDRAGSIVAAPPPVGTRTNTDGAPFQTVQLE